MKHFFRNLALVMGIFFGLNLVLAGILVTLAAVEDLTYVNYAVCHDKAARLDSLQGRPRLVIIGGSNTRFSLHSRLLRDSLGIEPVNMGIHIGLGLGYMFDEVEGRLGRGDTLVVMPEYEHFTDDIYYGDEGLTDMYFTQHRWAEAFDHLISHNSYRSLFQLTKQRIRRMNTAREDIDPDKHTRDKYNRYGDYTGHYTLPDREDIGCSPITMPARTDILDDISRRVTTLRKRGVTVLFFPPSYSEGNYGPGSSRIAAIAGSLQDRGYGYQTPPSRYVYPDSLFHDTRYHLNFKGGELHTRRLIEDLKRLRAGRPDKQ